jgi:hypothetical protein
LKEIIEGIKVNEDETSMQGSERKKGEEIKSLISVMHYSLSYGILAVIILECLEDAL